MTKKAPKSSTNPSPSNKWEPVTVDPKGAGHTYRLLVPGGWLYRTTTYRFPERHAMWEWLVASLGEEGAITYSNNDMGMKRASQWRGQALEIATCNTVYVRGF